MSKRVLVSVMCVAIACAFALVGCGGSSGSASSASASAASASASASSSVASSASAASTRTDFPAECIAPNGSVTLAAVLELNGPDLVALLEKQGYEQLKSGSWEKKDTEDRFAVCSADKVGDEMTQAEMEAATEVGSLAKGFVSLRTHAYDLSNISEETYNAARDSVAYGLTVTDTKYVAFGGEQWNIATDNAGNRYLLELGAYDETTLTVRLETDAYLAADGLGSIDKAFN